MSENGSFRLYHHRQDSSIRYEVRKSGDGYEAKHPGSPDDEAWPMDAETFEGIYEIHEEASEEEENK